MVNFHRRNGIILNLGIDYEKYGEINGYNDENQTLYSQIIDPNSILRPI